MLGQERDWAEGKTRTKPLRRSVPGMFQEQKDGPVARAQGPGERSRQSAQFTRDLWVMGRSRQAILGVMEIHRENWLIYFFFSCFFLMEDNCFTILYWPLLYINMNQLQIHICPLPPEPPFHVPVLPEGVSESRSVVSDSLQPHGLYSPWNSPGQNTGVGSLSLLQGIFPTQGSNPGLLDCRWILFQLSHKGSPRILEWVAYPFSGRSSQPRNRTGVSCIASGFLGCHRAQG